MLVPIAHDGISIPITTFVTIETAIDIVALVSALSCATSGAWI